MKRIRQLSISFAMVVVACATVDPVTGLSQPKVVPTNWLADFDYQSELRRYLMQRYDSARLEGATAYVYIYSDESRTCRRVRYLMDHKRFAPLLRDVRVSMLDFERLATLSKTNARVAFHPGNASGVFAKITFDGNLSDAQFYAAVFLCCPEYNYKSGRPTPRIRTHLSLAQELEEFFTINAET